MFNTVTMETKTQVFRDIYHATHLIWWYNHISHTTTEFMTTKKLDTSDMMMIKWVTNMSFRSPKVCSIKHKQPDILQIDIQKLTDQTNYVLDTLSTEYTHQAFTDSIRSFSVCVQLLWKPLHCVMVIMRRSGIPKSDYDLMAIMYPAHDTSSTAQ